jgi:hypothetical protein
LFSYSDPKQKTKGSSGVIVPTAITRATTWPVFLALIVTASIGAFDPAAAAVASIVLYS